MSDTGTCNLCGNEAKTKCSACKSVFYCDRPCQKKDWKAHKKVCVSRKPQQTEEAEIEELVDISNLVLKVEVRDSDIHGKGVFATEDISPGELLCFYDGEQKNVSQRVRMSKSDDGTLEIINANEVFGVVVEGLETVDNCMSHPNPKKHVLVVGHREPQSEYGIGQFVNDGARPKIDSADFHEGRQSLQVYTARSLKQANCEMGPQFWLKSTKRIRRGDELLLHYGFQFWLQKDMLEAKDPARRFLYYSLFDQGNKAFDLRRFYEYGNPTCQSFLRILIKVPESELDEHEAKDLIFKFVERIRLMDSPK